MHFLLFRLPGKRSIFLNVPLFPAFIANKHLVSSSSIGIWLLISCLSALHFYQISQILDNAIFQSFLSYCLLMFYSVNDIMFFILLIFALLCILFFFTAFVPCLLYSFKFWAISGYIVCDALEFCPFSRCPKTSSTFSCSSVKPGCALFIKEFILNAYFSSC